MIKFTGTQNAKLGKDNTDCGERKWQMTIKDEKIILWDYNYEGEKEIYNIPVHTDDINFVERPDNSGKIYRQIEFIGEWVRWFDHNKDISRFIECHIQTWDGKEFFVWAIWPHREYDFRGAGNEFISESVIVTFDGKSQFFFENIWKMGTQDKIKNRFGVYDTFIGELNG